MIIQAIPSSGKTTLSRTDERVTDMDDLIFSIVGGKNKTAYDEVMSISTYRKKINSIISLIQWADGILLTPYDIEEELGWPITFAVAYRPENYIEHIIFSNRSDLLDEVGEEKLKSWTSDYVVRSAVRPTIFLKSSEFLPCAISIWEYHRAQRLSIVTKAAALLSEGFSSIHDVISDFSKITTKGMS